MKHPKYAWRATLLLLAAVLTWGVQPAAAKSKPKILNRSLYLPVTIRFCSHLETALLYVDDQLAGRMPGERIFQFTYYPELERLVPEVLELRLEGERTNGEPFLARLAVTPLGIYTADRKIKLDTEESSAKFQYKIDVRHERVSLRLRCDASCGRETAADQVVAPIISEESLSSDGTEP